MKASTLLWSWILFRSLLYFWNILNNTLKHVKESWFNVISSQGTSFFKETSHFFGKSFSLCCSYCLNWSKVRFIANYINYYILAGMLSNTFNPFFDIFEGIFLCDIVHHKCSLSFSIVTMIIKLIRRGDCSILLLTS